MMQALVAFLDSLLETCRDVIPIAAIIIGFQLLVIRKPLKNPHKTALGFMNVILGITFFLDGLKMALFPLGELMASQLTAPEFLKLSDNAATDWRQYGWIYLFGACIGFSTTLAEPSLLAIANKAEEISGKAINAWGLRLAVSIGVAIGIGLGTFRIVTGSQLYYYIVFGYILVVIQTFFSPKFIIGLAYDSGGVTTSTVTVPLITALGLGLASAVPGRSPLLDGFGLVAFASLFPIITVLAYAQLAAWRAKKRNSNHS
jgi:hypothetical protein